MRCEEMLKVLGEYVDGELPAEMCEEFQKHLEGCDPCRVVVDTMRKTITLYKDGSQYNLPADFRSKLHDCLRKRWKEKNPETAE